MQNKSFEAVQQEERLSTYPKKITQKKTHNVKANKHQKKKIIMKKRCEKEKTINKSSNNGRTIAMEENNYKQ